MLPWISSHLNIDELSSQFKGLLGSSGVRDLNVVISCDSALDSIGISANVFGLGVDKD